MLYTSFFSVKMSYALLHSAKVLVASLHSAKIGRNILIHTYFKEIWGPVGALKRPYRALNGNVEK